MTATVEESVIQALDDLVPPCESPLHEKRREPRPPAKWLIFWRDPMACGHSAGKVSAHCDPCKDFATNTQIWTCLSCGRGLSNADVIRRIEPL